MELTDVVHAFSANGLAVACEPGEVLHVEEHCFDSRFYLVLASVSR